MTSYVNPYTGQTISPSQVGYEQLTLSSDTILQWPINGNTDNVVANIIEVTATTTGIDLFMPPATSVSTGQSALIRNIGVNAFTVVDPVMEWSWACRGVGGRLCLDDHPRKCARLR